MKYSGSNFTDNQKIYTFLSTHPSFTLLDS